MHSSRASLSSRGRALSRVCECDCVCVRICVPARASARENAWASVRAFSAPIRPEKVSAKYLP
eukprot:5714366-Pleurochrysis_carterae.AAC.1